MPCRLIRFMLLERVDQSPLAIPPRSPLLESMIVTLSNESRRFFGHPVRLRPIAIAHAANGPTIHRSRERQAGNTRPAAFPCLESFTKVERAPGRGFLPEVEELNPGQHPFGETYIRQYTGLVIETAPLLRQLLRDFHTAGGKVVVRKFNSAAELSSLPERLIFNATGLGSRMLFGDTSLRPMRAQLAVLLPQPGIDYSLSHEDGLYMFSRADGIVLGGTNELDDWNLNPDPATTERLLRSRQQVFSSFACSGTSRAAVLEFTKPTTVSG